MTTPAIHEAPYTPPSTGWAEHEDEADAKLARYLRGKDRRERKRAGKAGIRANRRTRWTRQRLESRERRDQRYHQRALAARRKVTNPDRKLTAAWRAYTGFAAAAGAVALAALLWMSVSVGKALTMGFAGYLVEGQFSVLLIVSVGTQVYATRHGHTVPKWQYVLDAFLLASSLVLNIVPWGTNTGWNELAALPAHALPPIALVCAVLMQYVLARVFGSILTEAHHATTASADHMGADGRETPDQWSGDLSDVPDQVEQTPTRPQPAATSDSDDGATDSSLEAIWSGNTDSVPDHGPEHPDQVERDGRAEPDHPDHELPEPTNTQVSVRSGAPDHSRSGSSPTPASPDASRSVVGHMTPQSGTATPAWSGNDSTAPQLVEQPTKQIPTTPAGQSDEQVMLLTQGLSHDEVADALAPVARALIDEGDFVSRADITNITDIKSSTTAGQVQQRLKERYPDHPAPTGRRKPERTRTIARALTTVTGKRYLQSVR